MDLREPPSARDSPRTVGCVARFDDASHPAVSLFLGGRGFLPSGLDTPIGLRIDAVFGSAQQHAITLDLDLIGFFALISGIASVVPHG